MKSVVIMHTLPLKVTPSNHYNVVMLYWDYENVMLSRVEMSSAFQDSEKWVGKIFLLTFLAI